MSKIVQNYQLISGGGVNYQMQMVQTYQLLAHFQGDGGDGGGKLPNANGPNLPTTNSFPGGRGTTKCKWSKLTNYQLISGGGGVKLPNANGPNLPTTNSFPGGVVVVVVNYQMQNVQTYQLPTHFQGWG